MTHFVLQSSNIMDLLGSVSAPAAAAAAPSSGGTNDLLDLLGVGDPSPAPAAPAGKSLAQWSCLLMNLFM